MENNSLDDLDLNEEPIDANRGTEYRIQYLTFLTARARYRQRRRYLQESAETGSFPTDGELLVRETGGVVAEGRNMERGKGCTGENSHHLVAKALEMDTEVDINSQEDGGGNFYDCNICLYIAREPVLTCCGHLFCWACFYKLPYADSFMKECPVCNGEVTDSTVVPIFGNGDSPRESKLDLSKVIPQRPRAQRVESARQQRVARGGFHIPVTEVLRRIRTSIGAINDEREEEEAAAATEAASIGILEQQQQQLSRTQHLPRVLSESGDSLYYISAALNSAQRDAAGMTSQAVEQQTSLEEIAEIIPLAPTSSRTSGVSVDFEHMEENPRTISGGEVNLPPPSSSRRRSSSRLSTTENDASHGTRRRRLR